MELTKQQTQKIANLSINQTLESISNNPTTLNAAIRKFGEETINSNLIKVYAMAVALQGKKDNPLNRAVGEEFIAMIKQDYWWLSPTEIQTAVLVGMRDSSSEFFVLSIGKLREFLDAYCEKRNNFFENKNQSYE